MHPPVRHALDHAEGEDNCGDDADGAAHGGRDKNQERKKFEPLRRKGRQGKRKVLRFLMESTHYEVAATLPPLVESPNQGENQMFELRGT